MTNEQKEIEEFSAWLVDVAIEEQEARGAGISVQVSRRLFGVWLSVEICFAEFEALVIVWSEGYRCVLAQALSDDGEAASPVGPAFEKCARQLLHNSEFLAAMDAVAITGALDDAAPPGREAPRL